MKKVVNSYTQVTEMHFDAKVISIGETVKTNENGKEYVVGTVEFQDLKNVTRRASALMYTKALIAAGTAVGDTVNCRALPPRDGENNVLLILDPIVAAERATADAFGFATTEANVPA
jgi:hypothetical protein